MTVLASALSPASDEARANRAAHLDALARQSGTSAFEVLTTLGARHRRQYRGEVSL